MRLIVVHLNVEVPDEDERTADQIKAAVVAALGSSQARMGPTKDYEALRELTISTADRKG